MDLSNMSSEKLVAARLELQNRIEEARAEHMPAMRAITAELDFRAARDGFMKAMGREVTAGEERLLRAARDEAAEQAAAASARRKEDAGPRKAAAAAAFAKARAASPGLTRADWDEQHAAAHG